MTIVLVFGGTFPENKRGAIDATPTFGFGSSAEVTGDVAPFSPPASKNTAIRKVEAFPDSTPPK